MKKNKLAVIAVVIAVLCAAFHKPEKTEPCGPNQKGWYIIKLDCLHQNDFFYLANAGYYEPATQSQVNDSCMGTECICAIWACKTLQGRPNLAPGSEAYNALYKWYWYSSNSGIIRRKDQVYL